MEIGYFYTGNCETAPDVSEGGPATRGLGVNRKGFADVEGGAAPRVAAEERRASPSPYLVVNIELDVLGQGADVSAGADVVVHDSGDGGVVESLWDPL